MTWPDLHALIEKFGSYAAISPEAWVEFDAAMETARQRYLKGWESAATKKSKKGA